MKEGKRWLGVRSGIILSFIEKRDAAANASVKAAMKILTHSHAHMSPCTQAVQICKLNLIMEE
jgi:hypothetical protein